MIFVWTTSSTPGSALIRWGRGTDCSHFAVVFDKLVCGLDQGCWLVGESRFSEGVDLDWWHQFRKRNRVVHALEYLPIEKSPDEREAYCAFGKKMRGRQYDKKSVLWLAFDSLLRKANIRNPYSENKWGDRDDVYCQEVITSFGEIFSRDGLIFTPRDVEMLDPHMAYEMLVTAPQFRKIDL